MLTGSKRDAYHSSVVAMRANCASRNPTDSNPWVIKDRVGQVL